MHNNSSSENSSSRRRNRTLKNVFAAQQDEMQGSMLLESMTIVSGGTQLLSNREDKQQVYTFRAEVKEAHETSNGVKKYEEREVRAVSLDSKDQIIQNLQQTNRMIASQVQSIWQKINDKIEDKKVRERIIRQDDNIQKLQKDLKNAYNWIKLADKEIERHKQRQKKSTEAVEIMKQKKQELRERAVIVDKLKNEINGQKKKLKEGEKYISQSNNYQLLGHEIMNKTAQVQYLMEIVREAEKNEANRMNSLKKQYIHIKKLEKQLNAKGISNKEVEEMKYRCINMADRSRTIPTTTQKTIKHEPIEYNKLQIDEIMDRSRQNFDKLRGEIKLLERKQEEFQREYSTIEKQKDRLSEKNQVSLQKIKEYEDDISKLEFTIPRLRNEHLEQHRLRKRVKSVQTQESSKTIDEKIRRLSTNLEKNSIKLISKVELYSSPIANIFNKKNSVSFGHSGKDSIKFNDKNILGRKHQGLPITEVIIYFSPSGQQICGLQAIYMNGVTGGEYVWKITDLLSFYKMERFKSEGNKLFVKHIRPTFKTTESGEELIGLEIVRFDGTRSKHGNCQPYEDTSSPTEYISCFSGSMRIISINNNSFSLIDQLSFDIYDSK